MTIAVNEQLFYLEVNMDEISNNSEELEMTDVMMRQQDLIDNATYDVCCKYLGIPDEVREKVFPWNMQILAEVRESITDALLQFGKPVCYPYIESGKEGSHYCNTEDCHCGRCIRDSERSFIFSHKFDGFEDRPMYFMKVDLDAKEQMRLLRQFGIWYKNTYVDTDIIAMECTLVTMALLDNAIVLNPDYIPLDEVLDELLSLIPDSRRVLYCEYFLKIQSGYIPDVEW